MCQRATFHVVIDIHAGLLVLHVLLARGRQRLHRRTVDDFKGGASASFRLVLYLAAFELRKPGAKT